MTPPAGPSGERRFVDLHTHSTASDGRLSPAELVRLADELKLAAVALTDHDTLDGLAEAQAAAGDLPDLRFVPGVEVSAVPPRGTLHILGLGVDPQSPAIAGLASFLREARQRRNPQILERLGELGLQVEMEDVRAVAGEPTADPGERVVGRPHIAEAMVRRGLVAGPTEAFEKYLARGRPAYVERERMSPRDTIRALREGGVLAALAHPVQLACDNRAQLETILRDLIAHGLNGIEVYHSDHTPEQTRTYLDLARTYDLAVTGGSDFHGATKPDVMMGRPRVPLAVVRNHPEAARLLQG